MKMKKVLATDTHLLEEITLLEQQIFPDPWSINALESSMTQSHGNIWVIEEDNQVTAYLIFYIMADEMEIARIAVLPEHRGKGYGKELLMQLFQYSIGNTTTQILLEVRANNEAAISLYKNQGFENVGIRKEYYTNPLEDAIIMNKCIQGTCS